MTLALVDYGAGNLTSVIKALRAVGGDVRVITSVEDVESARALVVPGVGNFATTASLGPAWHRAVRAAIDRGVPTLGVCVGMQWLFEGSAEAPDVPGLGLLPGRCFRLEGDVKVPHVGWNSLDGVKPSSRLFAGLEPGVSAYFTHSYAGPRVADTAATTTHAVSFSSAIERGRVFGVQFHPEKSGKTGLTMVKNFLDVASGAK